MDVDKGIAKIRCFVLDMDGTVYLGSRLLPGALEFVEYLRETERDFLFVTNNSSRHAEYYAKTDEVGNCMRCQEHPHLGRGNGLLLNTLKKGARVFLLGTPGAGGEFQREGFTLTGDSPDFVVLGFDKTLTYAKLVTACDWIRRGVPFIATHPDLNCPTESGYIPDCGAMTR